MIEKPKRRVLSVIGALPSHISSRLEEDGWMLKETNDLRNVYDHAKVGVINVSNSQFSLETLNNALYRCGDIKWLCILDEKSINSGLLRSIISEHCCNFLTLPLNVDLLSFSINQLWDMQIIKMYSIGNMDYELYPIFIPDCSSASSKIYNSMMKIALGQSNIIISGHDGTCFSDIIGFIHKKAHCEYNEIIRINGNSVTDLYFRKTILSVKKSGLDATIVIDSVGSLKPSVINAIKEFYEIKEKESIGNFSPSIRFIVLAGFSDVGCIDKVLLQILKPVTFRMPTLESFGDKKVSVIGKMINRTAKRLMIKKTKISDKTYRILSNYSWPGDFDELETVLIYILLKGEDRVAEILKVGFERSDGSFTISELREKNEHNAVLSAIKTAQGSIEDTKQILNVSRASVYRLIKKHGLVEELSKVRKKAC